MRFHATKLAVTDRAIKDKRRKEDSERRGRFPSKLPTIMSGATFGSGDLCLGLDLFGALSDFRLFKLFADGYAMPCPH